MVEARSTTTTVKKLELAMKTQHKKQIVLVRELKRLGLDNAYLVLLTRAGLKPMSRFENCSEPSSVRTLRALGLKTRTITRWTLSGTPVREIIFSRSEQPLAEYLSHFKNKHLARSNDDMRLEGRLFGYPACCVEHFIAHGYAPNSLSPADQRILFHWACPNCRITPVLLPLYRSIYAECERLLSVDEMGSGCSQRPWHPRVCVNAAALVASMAALLALPDARPSTQTPPPDPHWLSIGADGDPDGDLLSTEEEIILRSDPADADQNKNRIPDGADLAYELAQKIVDLPTEPSTTKPYAIHNLAFGLETCNVCGQTANMGVVTIVNPLENQTIHVPYIALHYLEHGSFQFDGTIHSGRISPPLLQTALTSSGFAHFIPDSESYDFDNDGLRDWEEPFFNTQLSNRDTNQNGVIDGAELMRKLRADLENLPRAKDPNQAPKDTPFVVEHPMKGIETCPRCGEKVGMNIWDIINPVTHAQMSIPSMALHYMEHSGPFWEGGQLMGGKGRINPVRLQRLLTGQWDGHWFEVQGDLDDDLLSDAEEVELRTDPRSTDEDKNRVPDGADLAHAVAAEIQSLPTDSAAPVYRIDFQLRGLETCAICGSSVNMGHLTICNRPAGLYCHVPYIALHYLEHGSFAFSGDVHGTGRLDVKLLVDSLHSKGPSHSFSVTGDTDADGLKDCEEPHFGLDKANPDSDHDGVPDGFQVARQIWTEIQAVPRTPNQTCYVVENPQRGLVTCAVCGNNVPMGWLEIINPKENLSLRIPYITLHFLRHGSFGASAADRINPCLLDIALHGNGSSHLVVWKGDTDRDGLLDAEENVFGTAPDSSDTDGDGILDGVAIARHLYRKIQALPVGRHESGRYRLLYEADCLTPCPVCAENINCGQTEVVNEWANKSLRMSLLNLHYLEHGSFAVSESERVDPVALHELLKPIPSIAITAQGVTLRWPSNPGRVYQVFTSPSVLGPWSPGPVLNGTGDELSFTDTDSLISPIRLYQVRMH